MSDALEWLEGHRAVQARVSEWWANPDADEIDARQIACSLHRSLVRIGEAPEARLLVKRFHAGSGFDRFLGFARAAVGRSGWRREWQTLTALRAAGVAVPQPLGLARTAGGDMLVVSEFIDGVSLWDELRDRGVASDSALLACGRAVASLHGAGIAHGDLHPGNLLLSHTGPVLIDFQRSAKLRRRTRIGDLARLDFSLALLGLPSSQRADLIRAALGPGPDTATEERKVSARSRRLAALHRRTRLRQSLRPGDGRVALHTEGHVGLRRVDFEEDVFRALLAAHSQLSAEPIPQESAESRHSERLIENGGRFYRVREDRPQALFSRLHQSVFGSVARRAWQQAHDPERRSPAGRLIAFSERRSHGLLTSGLFIAEEPEPGPARDDKAPQRGPRNTDPKHASAKAGEDPHSTGGLQTRVTTSH